MKSDKPELATLANGIDFALRSMYRNTPFEFLLVLAMPSADGDVTLNTITGITDTDKLYTIGIHLMDMAKAQRRAAGLDEFEDDEIQGHA
jgi:hypothetical protein